MTTGRKLALGGLIVAALIGYLAYRGASASWQYYLTADECLAERAVAGRATSARQRPHRRRHPRRRHEPSRGHPSPWKANPANLKVVCPSPLPDNLAEGIAVLVEGRLDDAGVLHGEKVLTRCASKYQSR